MESMKKNPISESSVHPGLSFHFCEIKTKDCTMHDPLEVAKNEEQFGMEKIKEEPTSYSLSQLESLLEVKQKDSEAQDISLGKKIKEEFHVEKLKEEPTSNSASQLESSLDISYIKQEDFILPDIFAVRKMEEKVIDTKTAKTREAGIPELATSGKRTSSDPINSSLTPNVHSHKKKTKLSSSNQKYDTADIAVRTCLSLSLRKVNHLHSNVICPEGDLNEQHTNVSRHSFTSKPCNKLLTEENGSKNNQAVCSGQDNIKCTISNKNIKKYETHQLIHTDQKPFKCDICNKIFTHQTHLKRHELIHTDQRYFKCDVCDKIFPWQNNLKRHQLEHTGQRPFKCDICNKTFFWKSHLKKHQLIHTVHITFMCDVCNNVYTCQHHLETHQLIHTL